MSRLSTPRISDSSRLATVLLSAPVALCRSLSYKSVRSVSTRAIRVARKRTLVIATMVLAMIAVVGLGLWLLAPAPAPRVLAPAPVLPVADLRTPGTPSASTSSGGAAAAPSASDSTVASVKPQVDVPPPAPREPQTHRHNKYLHVHLWSWIWTWPIVPLQMLAIGALVAARRLRERYDLRAAVPVSLLVTAAVAAGGWAAAITVPNSDDLPVMNQPTSTKTKELNNGDTVITTQHTSRHPHRPIELAAPWLLIGAAASALTGTQLARQRRRRPRIKTTARA